MPTLTSMPDDRWRATYHAERDNLEFDIDCFCVLQLLKSTDEDSETRPCAPLPATLGERTKTRSISCDLPDVALLSILEIRNSMSLYVYDIVLSRR